jgi:hypothetical protein
MTRPVGCNHCKITGPADLIRFALSFNLYHSILSLLQPRESDALFCYVLVQVLKHFILSLFLRSSFDDAHDTQLSHAC